MGRDIAAQLVEFAVRTKYESIPEEVLEFTKCLTFPDRDAFRKATAPAYDALYAKFGDRARKILEAFHSM
jgi:hypothetical protein